jgi:hypothetical protein
MTPDQARSLINTLRPLLRRVRGPRATLSPDTVLGLDDVEARLLAALERDDGPGPEHDGYPSGAKGSGVERCVAALQRRKSGT